jgi:DNA-binding LytR/AlgR family response regulator
VEAYLPPERFIKTHKSYIIAAGKVDSIEGSELRIGPYIIPVSRALREAVLQKLLGNRFLKRS